MKANSDTCELIQVFWELRQSGLLYQLNTQLFHLPREDRKTRLERRGLFIRWEFLWTISLMHEKCLKYNFVTKRNTIMIKIRTIELFSNRKYSRMFGKAWNFSLRLCYLQIPALSRQGSSQCSMNPVQRSLLRLWIHIIHAAATALLHQTRCTRILQCRLKLLHKLKQGPDHRHNVITLFFKPLQPVWCPLF